MPARDLKPALAERLVKLLGMVGSEHDGEALNAARMADKLVRDAGLTWATVIGTEYNADLFAVARSCIEVLQSGLWLKPEERRFLTGLPRYRKPTAKQIDWLNDLLARARAYAAEPPPPPPTAPPRTRSAGKRTPKPKPKTEGETST